jgi:hypothetical protein
MDFLTLVESGYRPPIAFETLPHLQRWMKQNRLEPRRVGKIWTSNAFVAHGKIPCNGLLHPYMQMWVRAKYSRYRSALTKHTYWADGHEVTFTAHDVDHSVSSTFLDKYWPNAWVNVLFVEHGINRSIGAMLEKTMPKPGCESIGLTAQTILKIFFAKEASLTRAAVESCLEKATKRFIRPNADAVLNAIFAEFDPSLSLK